MFLWRLFTTTATAVVALVVGIGIGLLMAPAKGSETRTWLASLIDRRAPAVLRNIGDALETARSAASGVVERFDPTSTDE